MSLSNIPSTILVDARALQDRDYRYRGVGQHAAVILRALRFSDWGCPRPRLIALTDRTFEQLAEEHAKLFDEIATPGETITGQALLLCLSPMTHNPTWIAKYLLDTQIKKVTLFYDLIQLQFPDRYLSSLEAQLSFLLSLAWLRKYDAFAAISQYSATELMNSLNVREDLVFVSHVAVRQGLEPDPNVPPLQFSQRKHILFAGGGDPRKNPECAVVAHGQSRELNRASVPLILFGDYGEETRQSLRKLHVKSGGQTRNIVFLKHLTDDELQSYYAKAIVTIVASKAEGFSVPIIESNASGTPVLASDVGAHPELLANPEHRFDPENAEQLKSKLEALCFDELTWTKMRQTQDSVWKRFTVESVGDNFLKELARVCQPVVSGARPRRIKRPSLSMLSPLPPAASGVADYSAATFEALARKADIHVYTATAGVQPRPWFKSLNSIGQARFSARREDAVVAIIGNSHFHKDEFDYLIDNGCAAIAHDARMINFYFAVMGLEKTLEIARLESGRAVNIAEVEDWLRNQERLPVLFLSEIASRSTPLMVHSGVTADLISKQYDKRPVVLPFAQYNGFDLVNARPEIRQRIRRDLDWHESDIVICTFGHVSDDKAPDELIWATKILNEWGVRAKLRFCGLPHGHVGERIKALCDKLHVNDRVSVEQEYICASQYKKMIFGADVGIQLRTYLMGGLSGALGDCIAAALPSIANDHLAKSMNAPSFIRRVSDKLSPILIAEAVLDIIDSGQNRNRPIEQAAEFAKGHSPDVYADRFLNALGLN